MSQVSWTRPLALATTLVVLGSVAYWAEFKEKPAKESSEELSKKLFNVKDTPVETIRIVSGSKSFTFHCLDLAAKLCKPGDNSKWELTEPVKLKADDSNVNALLSTINNLSSTDTIDLKTEDEKKRESLLKEYKLDPESRTGATGRRIEVAPQGKSTVIAYFGDTHPIGEGLFTAQGTSSGGKITFDDSRVLVVPSYFKTNFEKERNNWRDKKLLTIAAHDIQAFKLDGSKAHVDGQRKNGEWFLRSRAPGKTEEVAGDIENVDGLLSSVAFLNAKDFVTDDKNDSKAREALKGTKPVLTMTLQKEKESPITLTFYQKSTPPQKLLVTASTLDPLYEVELTAKDRFDKDFKDLRLAKLMTSMDRFTSKRLEFAGTPLGKSPLVLMESGGQWLMGTSSQDAKAPTDNDKVQGLLDKLSGNRIKDFLTPSAATSGEENGIRLSLGDDKNEKKREIVFWRNGEKLYARDLHSPRKEVFLVDSVIRDALPWERTYFNKAAPKK